MPADEMMGSHYAVAVDILLYVLLALLIVVLIVAG